MITDIHFSVIVDGAEMVFWKGNPKKNNSRTTGKILSECHRRYKKAILLGSARRCPTYTWALLESVAKFRDSTGRIQLISQEVTDEAA